MKLKMAGWLLPLVRRQIIVVLFKQTAQAFQAEMPPLEGLSTGECLREYAIFTRVQAGRALRNPRNQSLIQARLRQDGYHLASKIRKRGRLNSLKEVMAVARLLYRALAIDFEGTPTGEITIRQCYFSRFYSGQVCEVISALDEGILAGLAGEGKLKFSRRITEGYPTCRACFMTKEGQPCARQL
ncbi:MAG: hypothetical protein BGO39_28135 [Chloroflexi bacterium 54-19]|nr:MAG: hypothetical protein BGO39_28135 [Chloroflexi bacterium 54-19]